MIVDPRPLLKQALRGKYAVGAFNVNNLETLQGIIVGARNARAPVIVQTSEGAIEYAGMDMLVPMVLAAAKHTPTPVVLHLDHGKDVELVRKAIRSGYTSVMYDGSSLPYAENVRNTAQVVKWAHAKGVAVEAELGAIKGVEDFVSVSEREATFTNPEQALDFVERTGCDSLAVSIGTAHGAHKAGQRPTPSRSPSPGEGEKNDRFPPPMAIGGGRGGVGITLDIPRLRRIHALLPKTPLVLHGASSVPEELVGETRMYCSMLGDCQRLEGARGIPDKEIRAAIAFGVTKINTDTDLRIAFTAAVRDVLVTDKKAYDPRVILGPAREKVREVVEQRIKVFGSARKA